MKQENPGDNLSLNGGMTSAGKEARALAALQERSFARAGKTTRDSFPPERRMAGSILEQVLQTRSYLVVASTRGDGRPHATPSSFVWLDGELWLPTEPGTVRARNLSVAPDAALVLSEGEADSHAAIVIAARASLVEATQAPPGPAEAWAEKIGHLPEWATLWLELSPASLLSYAAPGWRLES